MASYNGTFSCGHGGVVNVNGPQEYRQYKIEQRLSGLCPECYEKHLKEERDKINLASMEAAKEISKYLDDELADYLFREEGNKCGNFEVTINDKEYNIQVLSKEVGKNMFEYEIFEIQPFENL